MQQFSKAFAGAFLATILAGSAVYSGGVVPTDQTASTVALTSAAIAPLPPSPVEIAVGFAGLLRVQGNISTIVLGDPGIADASPLDSGTILLNGQAAGTTNMIILNENGDVLRELMLHVSSRQPGTVTVRGALDPQVYSCASGICEGGSPPSSGRAAPDLAPAAQ